jgi:large subunit ribosomal protein L3
MGHRKQNAPRHGSISFMPRKRSRYAKGRLRNWLDYNGDPKFLGFVGFKAGMTHLAYIEDQKTSPFFGKELMKAATIIETPPIILFGIKIYLRDEYGLNPVGEILSPKLQKELGRKITIPDIENYKFEDKIKVLEDKLQEGMEIRGLFHTQPYKAPLPRIKPDIIEIKVSGGANCKEQFAYAKSLLGQEIRVRDILNEGSMIDVIGVSKGKGFQGQVKRFGVKLLPRKNRKGKRRIGSIGPIKPSRTRYLIARDGQKGFHNRVEYHKRIMKISENGDEINPKGGIVNYGQIKNDFVLLMGSVPGAKRRMIRLRQTIRPILRFVEGTPELTYISKQSHQGK